VLKKGVTAFLVARLLLIDYATFFVLIKKDVVEKKRSHDTDPLPIRIIIFIRNKNPCFDAAVRPKIKAG
jgi:hypothetical protein